MIQAEASTLAVVAFYDPVGRNCKICSRQISVALNI